MEENCNQDSDSPLEDYAVPSCMFAWLQRAALRNEAVSEGGMDSLRKALAMTMESMTH